MKDNNKPSIITWLWLIGSYIIITFFLSLKGIYTGISILGMGLCLIIYIKRKYPESKFFYSRDD
jgi:hypothetical protein